MTGPACRNPEHDPDWWHPADREPPGLSIQCADDAGHEGKCW